MIVSIAIEPHCIKDLTFIISTQWSVYEGSMMNFAFFNIALEYQLARKMFDAIANICNRSSIFWKQNKKQNKKTFVYLIWKRLNINESFTFSCDPICLTSLYKYLRFASLGPFY